MSTPPNPAQPDPDSQPTAAVEQPTDPETEIIAAQGAVTEPDPSIPPGERRYTAPSGMDGGTQIIHRAPEPETEVFEPVQPGAETVVSATPPADVTTPRTATPQAIPPRSGGPTAPPKKRSWGWVTALVLVIAALAAVAVLATLLLTRGGGGSAHPDRVRETIMTYDTAIQQGDLATLRSITCGNQAEYYNSYDDQQWDADQAQIHAAGQYPVIDRIDEVVINGEHAEANVTAFMASAPAVRSKRSLDLQFRDDHWKICQYEE